MRISYRFLKKKKRKPDLLPCAIIFLLLVCSGPVFFVGNACGQNIQKGPTQEGKGPPRETNTFQHKGEFSVITVGTGAPAYNINRSGPSALIHYKTHYYLVDMGNGTQARLIEAGIPFREIDTIMFTHFHLDHSEEFIPITINVWLQGQDQLKIIGPPGVREYFDFLISFYDEDMAYRAWRTGRSMEMIKNTEITELQGENQLERFGVSIRTAEVPHTIYTLAYRFDADNKSIVISGDLSFSENLIALSKGADILVIDGSSFVRKGSPGKGPPPGEKNRIKRGNKVWPQPHASLNQIAEMGEKANVKKIVLTHFGPGEIDEEATIGVIQKIYKGEIIFGGDLLEIIP